MKNGITVIELMVVLAIIALMGILMAPAIGEWMDNYRIKQATRDVVSTLQLARMRAISARLEYRVVFNVANERYQLERGDLPSASTTWTLEGDVKSCPRSVDIDNTNFTSDIVEFNPDGSSSNGSIFIDNAKGKQYRIRVTRLGRPAIQEGW